MAAQKKVNEIPEVIQNVNADMVMVKLPLDRQNKEDKVVWINHRRYLIKRGVWVKVPVAVKEVLDEEEKLLRIRYEYEEAVQDKNG